MFMYSKQTGCVTYNLSVYVCRRQPGDDHFRVRRWNRFDVTWRGGHVLVRSAEEGFGSNAVTDLCEREYGHTVIGVLVQILNG